MALTPPPHACKKPQCKVTIAVTPGRSARSEGLLPCLHVWASSVGLASHFASQSPIIEALRFATADISPLLALGMVVNGSHGRWRSD